jgi:lipoprotein NlpI
MFERAMEATPGEADLPSALGVLHTLSRDYNSAVEAFRRGLEVSTAPSICVLFWFKG